MHYTKKASDACKQGHNYIVYISVIITISSVLCMVCPSGVAIVPHLAELAAQLLLEGNGTVSLLHYCHISTLFLTL